MLTSPAIAYTSHPTDALFKAHFTASVMLTVYLMGCSTLLVAIVLGWNYSEQFNLTLQWLPHTAAFALLLWLTGGFWLLKRQQQHVQTRTRIYNNHVSHLANMAAMPTVLLTSNAPSWERKAFFSAPVTAPAAAPRQPSQPASLFGLHSVQ